jgi:Bacterial extracellular solute-binding proteins, family 5 Middle
MPNQTQFRTLALALTLLVSVYLPQAAATSSGQMTWGVHVSIAPAWFDPGEHSGIASSMMVFYALHDALVKPMPGNLVAPSLAQSWTVSGDGLVHDFVLRPDVVFHNGELMTAEDVKYSFERYNGAAAKLFKEKVAAVEVNHHRHRLSRMRGRAPRAAARARSRSCSAMAARSRSTSALIHRQDQGVGPITPSRPSSTDQRDCSNRRAIQLGARRA